MAEERATGQDPVVAVVCTRDRPELLEGALSALGRAARGCDQVVVVDSASVGAGTAEVARDAGFEVLRVQAPGVSRARNRGVAASSAQIVAFTDDDCRVAADWFSRMGAAFVDPTVGFVTGQVVADRQTKLTLSVTGDDGRRRFESVDDPYDFGHGANMAWRRAALCDIGGFDERMGPGGPLRAAEDKDAFWRATRAGWVGVHEPDLLVTHLQWRSTAGSLRAVFGYGIGVGALATKAIRMRAPGGWRLLGRGLWDHGLRGSIKNLTSGYESGAIAALGGAAGVALGAARASRIPLTDGRFR